MATSSSTSNTSLLTAQHSVGHVHLIIGSNPLAASRAANSLAAGAKPILIAPLAVNQQQLHYTLAAQIESGALTHIPRAVEESDLFTLGRKEVSGVVDAVFITATTNGVTPAAAAEIAEKCKRNRIPINVVDCPSLCSFSLLSVHVDGPLQVGVTTNGRGCKLASRIRREVAAGLPEGLGRAVERFGGVRRRILEEAAAAAAAASAKEVLADEGVDDSVDQGPEF
ncbi:Uroporphyrinogen-III C-methyltransferase, partial [Cladorrhinum sp. PSN332]